MHSGEPRSGRRTPQKWKCPYLGNRWTDLDQNWYEASLRARAEQGQVANEITQWPRNPQLRKGPYLGNRWTDLDQNWCEASLGAGAEQGQVADAFGHTVLSLAAIIKWKLNAKPRRINANLKTIVGILFKKASTHECVALLSVALPGR